MTSGDGVRLSELFTTRTGIERSPHVESLRYLGFVVFVMKANKLLHRLLVLMVSVALATMNFGASAPVTPRGVQCPTAPIQQVVETKYVKNCCGELVAQTTVRKPHEGEAEFKQCRCAEKKAADHQDEKQATESVKPIPLAAMSESLADLHFEPLQLPLESPVYVPVDRKTPVFAPPTPPPQFI